MAEHRQALVRGRLALGLSPRASLPALVRMLRLRCDAAALSGGLLFDGERVVMLFEGESTQLARVLEELAAAPQLETGIESLADRKVDAGVATRWISGYAEPELVDALGDGDADALAQAFKRSLGASDAQ